MTANEILADIEIYEKFDPVKGTVEGKTYVVVPTTTETGKNSDVVINRHITLAHNTTLIFAGGKISGTGTLTGDNTRLSPYYPNFWRRHHRRRHLGNGSRLSSMVRGKKRYFQQ